MKQNKISHLVDMVDDIKELDEMISLHKKENASDFSTGQYVSRKNRLIADFIDELVTSVSVNERNFLAVKLALDKFYPDLSDASKNKNEDDLAVLEMALR